MQHPTTLPPTFDTPAFVCPAPISVKAVQADIFEYGPAHCEAMLLWMCSHAHGLYRRWLNAFLPKLAAHEPMVQVGPEGVWAPFNTLNTRPWAHARVTVIKLARPLGRLQFVCLLPNPQDTITNSEETLQAMLQQGLDTLSALGVSSAAINGILASPAGNHSHAVETQRAKWMTHMVQQWCQAQSAFGLQSIHLVDLVGGFSHTLPNRIAPLLRPKGDGCILYYPGCGTDLGPLRTLAATDNGGCDLSAVIYVDYLAPVTELKKRLRQMHHGQPLVFSNITPSQLGHHHWGDFWSSNINSRYHAHPNDGRGFVCEIALKNGRRFKFIYLRTDGVETYINLLHTPLQPHVVVLQDHGFGANWTEFGGENEMYQAAQQQAALPPWLYVANNTRPWPGYSGVGKATCDKGQMHHYKRRLFQRCFEAQTNTNPPPLEAAHQHIATQ